MGQILCMNKNPDYDISSSSWNITETYTIYTDDVYDNGYYNLEYPQIGMYHRRSWDNPYMLDEGLECTNIRLSSQDLKKHPANGRSLSIITATYSISKIGKFKLRESSGGFKEYNIKNGAKWLNISESDADHENLPPDSNEGAVNGFRLPITRVSVSTQLNYKPNLGFFEQYRGTLNDYDFSFPTDPTIFSRGCVKFNGASVDPVYAFDNTTVILSQISMEFEILGNDWNVEWHNPEPALNPLTFSPMRWQNHDAKRIDYNSDENLNGILIPSGTELKGKKLGDDRLGKGYWGIRLFPEEVFVPDENGGHWEIMDLPFLKYAVLDEVFNL